MTTDDGLFDAYWAFRYMDGRPDCPRCAKPFSAYIYTRLLYKCGACGYQESLTAGTMFHGSKLPVEKLVVAICAVNEEDVTAAELARRIGVTYKTAHILKQRIISDGPVETRRPTWRERGRQP